MRIKPSPEMAIAMACAAVMLVAVGWYVVTEIPEIPPEKPTWKGESVVNVTAAVPSIGSFEREFHVNNQDPFLPFSLRSRVAAIQDRIPDTPHISNPRFNEPPPAPPPVPPVIHWPAAAMRQPGPTCIGLITTSQGSLLLGRMPHSEVIVAMSVGDAIPKDPAVGPQWTLLSVDGDGLARFRDPSGGEVVFPIGAPPSDPPPSTDEPKPTPVQKVSNSGQLPTNFNPGTLQLPPNWQSRIPPGMQKEVQQQIMQQIMQMQAQQAQGGGSGK